MMALVRLAIPVVALAVGASLVAVQPGCHRSNPTSELPASVRGRVSFQGRAVAGCLVIFTPDRDRGASGPPLRAETDPEGIFQLKSRNGPAIESGWYRVAIAPPAADSTAGTGSALFPPQLRRPDTSTIVRQVLSGKENFFELAVEAPGSR